MSKLADSIKEFLKWGFAVACFASFVIIVNSTTNRPYIDQCQGKPLGYHEKLLDRCIKEYGRQSQIECATLNARREACDLSSRSL